MTDVCRGCGGTGLDHKLTPREYQLATRQITLRKDSVFNGVTSGQVASIRISNEPRKARLAMDGPLAHVLKEIERLGKLGYRVYDDSDVYASVAPSPEWACDWCHGTGVPQLSAATMGMAVKA